MPTHFVDDARQLTGTLLTLLESGKHIFMPPPPLYDREDLKTSQALISYEAKDKIKEMPGTKYIRFEKSEIAEGFCRVHKTSMDEALVGQQIWKVNLAPFIPIIDFDKLNETTQEELHKIGEQNYETAPPGNARGETEPDMSFVARLAREADEKLGIKPEEVKETQMDGRGGTTGGIGGILRNLLGSNK